MRFWLLLTWRRGWAVEGIDARIVTYAELADTTARTHNAAVVEITETSYRTFVDVHDYELLNGKGEPCPATWIDAPAYQREHDGVWVVPPVPIVRVGKDMSRKEYEEAVTDG